MNTVEKGDTGGVSYRKLKCLIASYAHTAKNARKLKDKKV